MNLKMINDYADKQKIGPAEKIVYTSTVMHTGWESDNAACLVKMKNGTHKLFTTNHGAVCEMSGKDLEAVVKEASDYFRDVTSLLQLAQENGAIKKNIQAKPR